MTNFHKNEILLKVRDEIKRLGSANKVSNKCGVSTATISNIMNGIWDKISITMWQKIAFALQIKFSGWQLAETGDFKRVTQVLRDAKEMKIFIPICNPAGTGKTQPAFFYSRNNFNNSVFYILCNKMDADKARIREIGKKEVEYDRQVAITGEASANMVLYFWMKGYKYRQNELSNKE